MFGARPLKRLIQRMLQNPIALELLEGKFSEGDTILAEVDGKGGLTLVRRAVGEKAGA